jgi:hypothetical protein
MSFENQQLRLSVNTAISFASLQYTFVNVSTLGLTAPTASTVQVLGVVQDNNANIGTASEVAILGTTKVVAGGSISIGQYVGTNAVGKAVHATTGFQKVGIALEASTASGQIIAIALIPSGAAA